MNAEQYRDMIREAVSADLVGDGRKLDLLARNLEMLDDAKQELRNKGYGWLGLDILQTAMMVPESLYQGGKAPKDSTGRFIHIGNKVRFRGQIYTIKEFLPGQGTEGTARIIFNEPQHTDEPADEISVDLC